MAFRIPDAVKPAAKELLSLDAQLAPRFIDAVLSTPPRASAPDFAKDVAARLPDFPHVEQMVQVLSNLLHVHEHAKQPLSNLLSDLAATIDLPQVPTNWLDHFRPVLEPSGPLALTHKATDLLFSHEKPLSSLRIVSDLRPIFGSEVSAGPKAFLLFHNLLMQYYDDDEERTLEVVMDRGDLEKLQVAVNRALAKDEVLRRQTGLKVLV